MTTEEEFYEKAPEWIKDDISKWNHITMLAYFCQKYENRHNVKFKLTRSKKGVELSKESADLNKLFKIMAPQNYDLLEPDQKRSIRAQINLKQKNFINWIFDYKFRSGNKSINGTKALVAYNLLNEFERDYAAFQAKQNQVKKIDLFLNWCQQEISEIFNFHQLSREEDLKLINRYAEQYQLDESSLEKRAIKKAKEMGLLE